MGENTTALNKYVNLQGQLNFTNTTNVKNVGGLIIEEICYLFDKQP